MGRGTFHLQRFDNIGSTINNASPLNMSIIIHYCLFNFTAGQDFVARETVVGFSPGESIVFLSVLTSTDSINEGDEVFEGVLTLAPSTERINLGSDVARAIIRNNGPPVPQNICQTYYTRSEL